MTVHRPENISLRFPMIPLVLLTVAQIERCCHPVCSNVATNKQTNKHFYGRSEEPMFKQKASSAQHYPLQKILPESLACITLFDTSESFVKSVSSSFSVNLHNSLCSHFLSDSQCPSRLGLSATILVF